MDRMITSGNATAPSSALHTGAAYFRYITQGTSDREARAAFHRQILDLAAPGAQLFDFGAGPGIDARFLAERGFSVRAYDVDPAMCDFFGEYCGDLIAQDRIVLERGSYREFLDRPIPQAQRPAELVIANFAPLNLVPDVRELFAKFDKLTGPGGKVLASVLNPFYLGEMRHLWWWRIAPRLLRDGHFRMPGPQAPHTRRLVSDFASLCSPSFMLSGVYRGLPSSAGARRRDSWYRMVGGRFMFLLFEKPATSRALAGTHSSI
jgi:SAM-dependent methyltransferase